MEQKLFSVGKIVNAHGVRGEVTLLPESLEPACLAGCKTFYLDGTPVVPLACRTHKGCLLLTLPGITSRDAALALKGKIFFAYRRDLPLPEGVYLDGELIGLAVRDERTGETVGILEEVLSYPAHKIYAVRGGKDEYLVPAVPAFIKSVNLPEGVMDIRLWEGLGTHED